ncbi:MAG: DUF2975 domain-containing protein [Ruminococcus sp.]|nr:DUF2975 domain-containing protein [Ruminococcus sp.]
MKKTNKKKDASRLLSLIILPYMLVVLLFFYGRDFIKDITSDKDSYEIRYQEDVTYDDTDGDGKKEEIDMTGGQKIYMLYRNGDYRGDVDINEFDMLDDDGNTDYRYCALIQEVRGFSYTVILFAMITLILFIVRSLKEGTPFTKANAKRIKAVGILQFCLAVVPGLVVFLMKFFRFSHIRSTFTIDSLYMFIIGFVIMFIGQVFDYGVKLQEDNDLIA